MRHIFDVMSNHAAAAGDRVTLSDEDRALTCRELFARVVGLMQRLKSEPRVVGLFAPNGTDWAVGQLACAFAGKIAVPLPTFFSDEQLGHVVRDASVGLILATEATWPRVMRSGASAQSLETISEARDPPVYTDGFGQVIYTSGSTGRPKGVRHESGQVAWSSAALAAATDANADDQHLSVLPLSLLLETIGAVFVPQLVGARVHFDRRLSENVARGNASGLADTFERHRPTTSILVPQLLKAWVGELSATGRRAPDSLRFVAVGGAPVPAHVAADAWFLGIPAHEGYGLSECCSVVSVNRVGGRRPGTAGRPLEGLEVTIEEGEIVVDGPSVTDGYLGQPAAARPWRTGDLGSLDTDGFLRVLGRKDDLIVTSFGRNISPEWIENMLLDDSRVASCGIIGHGEPSLTAIFIPSASGKAWFAAASDAEVFGMIADRCATAPDYAVPKAFVAIPFAEAAQAGLLTRNGSFVRKTAAEFTKSSAARRAGEGPIPHPAQRNQ